MDKWLKKDRKFTWHPFTQAKDCRKRPPILIERAKGIKICDSAGRAYYDTISSWWCNVHGHNHPRIVSAINKQLKTLDHVLFAGFTHKPAIALAERLIGITPKGLTRVFFSDNGSTAVETALKMSLQYWRNTGEKKKTGFVCLDLAYHGDTCGAMSVGGDTVFNRAFKPLLFDTIKVSSPYCYRCPMGKQRDTCRIDCIKPLEMSLKRHNKQLAALILEPLLMAAAGMVIYPADYLRRAAVLAKKYNVHLIADEVATGFGRTGAMFACEHAGVRPDFLCLSKGLTSGTLPFAATLTTEKIYRGFWGDYDKYKTLYHGHTYTANPIGCAAAMASLDIFQKEGTLKKIRPLIKQLHAGMERFRPLPFVGDVRCIGMVAAVELVRDKKTRRPFDVKQRIGQKIYQAGLKEGLILRPLGDIIYLFLPLCVTKTQLETILRKMLKVVKQLRF